MSPEASPQYSVLSTLAEHDWWQARDVCSAAGGSLPVIQSAQENAELVQFLNENSVLRVWLGLGDSYSEGYYEWTVSNDHRFPLGSYTNWASGHPSNSNFAIDCVDMPASSAQWRTRACNQLKPVVCRMHATGRRLAEADAGVPALPAPPEQTGADFLLQQYIKLAKSGLKI